MAGLNLAEQQVFIPEKYVTHLELLVQTDEYGRGIMVKSSELNHEIASGRISGNVIINRDAVYILKEVSATPVLDEAGFVKC